MRLMVSATLLAVLCCGACGQDRTPDPVTRPSPERSAVDATRIPVTPVAPRLPAQTGVSTIAPLSTVNSPQPSEPEIFASPAAVSIEWLRQWCSVDWREPMNANLDRASRYQTPSSVKGDRRKGDDEQTYKAVQAQQLSSGCDEFVATPSPEAPQSAHVAYLMLSARRVNSAAGVAFETEQVRSVRRVLQQADARWLVDEQVEAG